jgi:hypothetical protein
MKKKVGRSVGSPRSSSSAISRSALADFLIQLSELYGSPEFGNRSLAMGLRELAVSVRRGVAYDPHQSRRFRDQATLKPGAHRELLKRLDRESVERFIADEKKSKAELLDLAAARFSIPRSQLKRMKIADVRHAISAAVHHERSLEILSEEASRDASARMS